MADHWIWQSTDRSCQFELQPKDLKKFLSDYDLAVTGEVRVYTFCILSASLLPRTPSNDPFSHWEEKRIFFQLCIFERNHEKHYIEGQHFGGEGLRWYLSGFLIKLLWYFRVWNICLVQRRISNCCGKYWFISKFLQESTQSKR